MGGVEIGLPGWDGADGADDPPPEDPDPDDPDPDPDDPDPVPPDDPVCRARDGKATSRASNTAM